MQTYLDYLPRDLYSAPQLGGKRKLSLNSIPNGNGGFPPIYTAQDLSQENMQKTKKREFGDKSTNKIISIKNILSKRQKNQQYVMPKNDNKVNII